MIHTPSKTPLATTAQVCEGVGGTSGNSPGASNLPPRSRGRPGVTTFGKYQVLERIAIGEMAEVVKARLPGLGGFERIVALKRVLPHLNQDAKYVRLLVGEAKMAGLLSHANVVQILDLGQVDGQWFIAMEYVHGVDLGSLLERASRRGLHLPVPHALFIAAELLKALAYAHGRQVLQDGVAVPLNVVHRDINPKNVLVSFQGEVKLTDFGIARANLKARETVAAHVKGRFDYRSPEQAEGMSDLDQRSDLFSVGTVLAEMLTGRSPFRGESEPDTLERVRTAQRDALHEANPELPMALEAIVAKALTADRNERYPTAEAFEEAVGRFFSEMGFLSTQATLAAYVRTLFPEVDPRPGHVRPDDGDILDADDDVSLDQAAEGARRLNRAVATMSDIALPQMLPVRTDWEEDVATQLRRPDGLEARAAKVGDLETVVRAPKSDLSESSDSGSLPARGPVQRKPRPVVPTPAPAPARSQPWVGLLGGALSLMTGVLGLLVGVVLALALVWAMGLRAPAVLPDPVVRVTAPAGTEVRLDDEPVGTEFTVAAGAPHVVTVTAPGAAAWRRSLTLPGGASLELLVLTTAAPAQ